jgi:hypothetical protein
MPPTAFISCDFLQQTADVGADVLRGQGILPNSSLSDALTRKIRAGYAAGVTWVDMQVGKVLDRLDSLGLANTTVVVFTADHGWGLGENGIWCKYCVFENQVRVPLFVRVPWWPELHGTTSDALLELVDLMPTLADVAGFLPQVLSTEALDGDSFLPLLRPSIAGTPPANVSANEWQMPVGESTWTKEFAFSQYPRCMNSSMAKEPPYTPNRDPCCSHEPGMFTHMGLSVRSKDWRYSEWRRWDGHQCTPHWGGSAIDGVELYDHRDDRTPGCFDCFEHTNVADDVEFAEVVAQLRQVVEGHFKKDGVNATGCPKPVTAEEQAGVDMTGER